MLLKAFSYVCAYQISSKSIWQFKRERDEFNKLNKGNNAVSGY